MPTRLSISIAGLLLLLGSQPLAAQPPGLPAQASPGLTLNPRPALLTTSPVNQVLPADSAFALSVQWHDDTPRLQLHWDIAPDYYLYRKSLKLVSATGAEVDLELPPGEAIEDEFFGAVEVYFGALTATAATDRFSHSEGALQLVVEYQGCAAERYCYPPQRKELQLPRP